MPVDFEQKAPGISNNSFNHLCYVLVQRRCIGRRGEVTGRVMFFLLRMAFWLCVVCLLLPGGTKSTPPDSQIDATEAVSLANAAVTDARGFCERQPDACVTGGKVAVAIGHKAEAGARTLYEFISKIREKAVSKEKADKQTVTGSTQGTLTPSDMAPAYRAPVPLPPRRDSRTAGPAA